MRKRIAGSVCAVALVALAGDVRGQSGDEAAAAEIAAQEAAEAENQIALEDLPPDEQANVIDDAAQDAAEAPAIAAWTAASAQLVAYAEYVAASREAGVDLGAVGIE